LIFIIKIKGIPADRALSKSLVRITKMCDTLGEKFEKAVSDFSSSN